MRVNSRPIIHLLVTLKGVIRIRPIKRAIIEYRVIFSWISKRIRLYNLQAKYLLLLISIIELISPYMKPTISPKYINFADRLVSFFLVNSDNFFPYIHKLLILNRSIFIANILELLVSLHLLNLNHHQLTKISKQFPSIVSVISL